MGLHKVTNKEFVKTVESRRLLDDTSEASRETKIELLKQRGYSNLNVKRDYIPNIEKEKELYSMFRKEEKLEEQEKIDELDSINERISIILDSCTPNFLNVLAKKFGENRLGEYANHAREPKMPLAQCETFRINNAFKREYYSAQKKLRSH